MLKKFYERYVLTFPKVTLLISLIILSFFAYNATKLKIDASSDTILLKNDSDLLFTQEMAKTFKTSNILVVAFSPYKPLLSKPTLKNIEKISNELLKLEKVESITSILNVPLLQSSNKAIKELINDIPTLKSKNIDIDKIKQEFSTSPLYKNNLVSEDFKTTAIILNLKNDKTLSSKNRKTQRDTLREKNHIFIQNIRNILQNNENAGQLFLGGVNMISDDLITFVKNDLYTFGITLVFLLVLILKVIFKEIRWVVLPIFICAISIIATSGLLGYFGWEVTVISSNFISLQLIITMSIVLHLIVRYLEVVKKEKNLTHKEVLLEVMISKFSPSFYAVLTTIVGFASLLFANILPIINLGWMMSSGIAISLVISFMLFPSILILLPISKPQKKIKKQFLPTVMMANWVEFNGKTIIFITIVISIFSITGALQLIVENSFINYFRPTTEIYKGMKVIDEKLGGTTPLDLIVKFKDKPVKATKNITSDFDSFDSEFEQPSNGNQYWFTPRKMRLIEKIHDYLSKKPEIGNVQSFATTLKIGKTLNGNKELDNFALALLYNKLPEKYKDILLNPYINIKNNEIRFAMRVIDSNPQLRRDELIKDINFELSHIIKPSVAEYRLTNLMILYNNMLQSLFNSQILTLGLVLILLFVMFWAIFKSLKIALIAITSNAIPMSVFFGFMGWFHIPLDMMTITIAAISLGIGVDDTIHYLHRFYKELQKDGDFTKAMYRSHKSIGYAMYYTTFAIMLGFSILVMSNFTPTVYFGFLTVIVMLMALLGALLLLPKLILIFKPMRG